MKYTFLNKTGDLAFGEIGKFLDDLPKGKDIALRDFFKNHELDCKLEDLTPVLNFYQRLGHLEFNSDTFVINVFTTRKVPVQ